MAAKAGRLQVQLEMEVAQLRRDLAATSTEFKRTTGQWKSNLDEFARGFKTAFATGAIVAGVAAVSTAMSGLFRKFDEVADGAKRIGTSAETFQQLQYAAEQSGVAMDTLEGAITRMQRSLGDIGLGKGKAAADALRELGMSSAALEGMAPEQVMLALLDALSQVQDKTRQAALGAAIFGKSFTDLRPAMEDGAQGLRELMQQAKNVGAVMSNETVAAGEAFNDAMARLKEVGTVALSEFFEPILPLLTQLARGLTDSGDAAKDAAGGYKESGSALGALGQLVANTLAAVQALGNTFGGMAAIAETAMRAALDNVGTLWDTFKANIATPLDFSDNLARTSAAMDTVRERAAAAKAAISDINSAVTETNRQIQQAAQGMFRGVTASVGTTEQIPGATGADAEDTDRKTEAINRNTAAKRANTEADREAEQSARELRQQQEAMAALALDLEEAQRRLRGETEEQVRQWRLTAEGADAYARSMSDMGVQLDTLQEAVRRDLDAKESLKTANIDLEASQMRLAGATEEQVQAFQDAAQGLSQYAIAARKAAGQADQNNAVVAERAQQAQDMTQMVGHGIADIFLSMQEGAKAAEEALIRLVAQLVAAIATAQILQAFNLTGVGGGTFGARGLAFDGGGYRAFAQGGIVMGATPFTFGGGQHGVMGEAGPEAIMPLTRGADGKLGVAGGTQVQIFNYAGAQVTAEQDGERVRVIVDQMRSTFANDIARGGNVISSSLERAYGVRR